MILLRIFAFRDADRGVPTRHLLVFILELGLVEAVRHQVVPLRLCHHLFPLRNHPLPPNGAPAKRAPSGTPPKGALEGKSLLLMSAVCYTCANLISVATNSPTLRLPDATPSYAANASQCLSADMYVHLPI